MKNKTTLFNTLVKPGLTASLLFLILFSAAAQGEEAQVTGKITRTLAGDGYNGCMVLLDVNVRNLLPNCGPSWVSLDCNAVYRTPEASAAMWSSAITAFALNKTVVAYVRDDQKANGYCSARRIDIVR